ncbi:hypothetical protein EJ110_NYTH37670 [Nymphaea thermarum]|nr:hypothetical protein EJ110_NYTH37670 [Nymphaea thermarum]
MVRLLLRRKNVVFCFWVLLMLLCTSNSGAVRLKKEVLVHLAPSPAPSLETSSSGGPGDAETLFGQEKRRIHTDCKDPAELGC